MTVLLTQTVFLNSYYWSHHTGSLKVQDEVQDDEWRPYFKPQPKLDYPSWAMCCRSAGTPLENQLGNPTARITFEHQDLTTMFVMFRANYSIKPCAWCVQLNGNCKARWMISRARFSRDVAVGVHVSGSCADTGDRSQNLLTSKNSALPEAEASFFWAQKFLHHSYIDEVKWIIFMNRTSVGGLAAMVDILDLSIKTRPDKVDMKSMNSNFLRLESLAGRGRSGRPICIDMCKQGWANSSSRIEQKR